MVAGTPGTAPHVAGAGGAPLSGKSTGPLLRVRVYVNFSGSAVHINLPTVIVREQGVSQANHGGMPLVRAKSPCVSFRAGALGSSKGQNPLPVQAGRPVGNQIVSRQDDRLIPSPPGLLPGP